MRQNVRYLIASTGFFSVGYSLLIFAIPLFAISVGSSQSELGFIALAYTLPFLVGVLLVGRFLNKAEALRVIQVVLIAHALSTMIFPYASNFLQLAGIRTLQGFSALHSGWPWRRNWQISRRTGKEVGLWASTTWHGLQRSLWRRF